jgi:hypothetical protein
MNLRKASKSQNAMNMKTRYGTSKFKGVRWQKRDKKWEARIRNNGKLKFLGYFDDEEEATRAYDEEARKIFGGFARLNFRGDDNEQGRDVTETD